MLDRDQAESIELAAILSLLMVSIPLYNFHTASDLALFTKSLRITAHKLWRRWCWKVGMGKGETTI